jgi:hypothetical protein
VGLLADTEVSDEYAAFVIPEDGGSMFLRYVVIYLKAHVVLKPGGMISTSVSKYLKQYVVGNLLIYFEVYVNLIQVKIILQSFQFFFIYPFKSKR